MQFHSKYADKAKLDDLVKTGGYTSWKELFIAKVGQADGGGYGQYSAQGRPVLYAWVTEPADERQRDSSLVHPQSVLLEGRRQWTAVSRTSTG